MIVPRFPFIADRTSRTRANMERVAFAGTLVAGGAVAGLCYEVIGRPFDNARHLTRVGQLNPHIPPRTLHQMCLTKLRQEGIVSFFRDPHAPAVPPETARGWQYRLYTASRALARVGPWGVGFLAFEYWSPSVN
jgi:hypothetical protein